MGGITTTLFQRPRDPNFNQTTLLLSGNFPTNGAQNNTFIDSSSNGFTITRNPSTGPNAPTQGSFSPFSQTGWGNYFGGSDFFTVAYNSAFSPGSGDFTVECFVYFTANPAGTDQMFVSNINGTTGNGDWCLFWRGGASRWEFSASSSGAVAGIQRSFNTTTPSVGIWYHVVGVKSGSTLSCYVNGVKGTDGTLATVFDGSLTLNIAQGAGNTARVTGYLSNVRITKGGALYSGSTFNPPTSPLTNTVSSGTVSLLTCQSNRFVDNSASPLTITVNGTPSVQAFSPFVPSGAYTTTAVGGSGYFDGTGDFLSAASNSVFAPGTGDFAIQCWVYFTSVSGTILPICQNDAIGTSSNDKFWVGIQSNTLRLGQHNSANVASCPLTPVANQWYNIAISRVSGTVYMWINGVSQTVTNSTVFSSTSFGQNGFVIGGMSTPYYLTGYMTSFQYQVGTGFTSYTLPTAPTNTPATNARLLLNFTNAGIVDSTAKNVFETTGNAQISTTQSKFGGTSMYFDGTGDSLFIPPDQKENLRFGTGNFTIEFWAWKSANGSSNFDVVISVSTDGNANGGFFVELSTSRGFLFAYDAAVRIQSSGTNPNDSTWHHYAVVRNGSTFALYRDGVQLTTATLTPTLGITGNAYIAALASSTQNNFNGYIDDLRVTKGVARYTANFNVPTIGFTDR